MSTGSACHVVETNVALVASALCGNASADCIANCVSALRSVMDDRCVLALDDDGHILAEYKKKLSASGEKRIGDVFLKWIYINQHNPFRCRRVAVYSTDSEGLEFDELKGVTGIEGFDADDKKFLVTALRAGVPAPILNAVDSDWLNYRTPIEAAGATVVFLCGEAACVRGGHPHL